MTVGWNPREIGLSSSYRGPTVYTLSACDHRRPNLTLRVCSSQESRCRVTNDRWDFVWEIKYWGLQTLNVTFFFYKINKRDLPWMYSLCSLVWIKASTSTVFFLGGGGGGGLLFCYSRNFSLYEVLKGSTEKNSRRSRSCLLEGCPNRRLFSVFFFFSVLPFNTSYYEESDRRHTITAKKNPTKLMNSSWKFFLPPPPPSPPLHNFSNGPSRDFNICCQ